MLTIWFLFYFISNLMLRIKFINYIKLRKIQHTPKYWKTIQKNIFNVITKYQKLDYFTETQYIWNYFLKKITSLKTNGALTSFKT